MTPGNLLEVPAHAVIQRQVAAQLPLILHVPRPIDGAEIRAGQSEALLIIGVAMAGGIKQVLAERQRVAVAVGAREVRRIVQDVESVIDLEAELERVRPGDLREVVDKLLIAAHRGKPGEARRWLYRS